MMLKDKNNQSTSSSDLVDSNKIKPLPLDISTGFVCDMDTGICGPVAPKKEGKE